MQKSLEDRGPFGQFLYLQLKNHHRKSARWLADELEKLDNPLDPSLIRRWMSGERVPQEDHEAISRIARILNCSDKEILDAHKSSISWLKEKKKHASQKKKVLRSSSDNLLNQPQIFQPSQDKTTFYDVRGLLQENQKSIGIKKARPVLETVICFLESLPNSRNANDELLLMIQGRIATIEEFAEDLQPRWYEAVRSALKKGWKVIHVVRIDDDLERIKKMVRGILLLVGHEGEYKPLAFKQKFVLPVAESFMLAPSLNEGMIFYAGEQQRYVDSAIYIKDELQISILEKHFKQLMKEMHPVFHIEKKYLDVISRLQHADEVPGNRIVILKRLSDIMRPRNLYKKSSAWAKAHQDAHDIDLEDLKNVLEFRQLRHKKLKQHSLSHRCRYIYTRKCIGNYLKSGQELTLPTHFASISERISQITVLQELLKYPQYEMALTEEDIFRAPKISQELVRPTEIPDIIPNFCEVLENHLALMQIPVSHKSTGKPTSKWIVIEEPIIVKALYQYLLDIWEVKIPELRRQKFQILLWLEEEKRRLQKIRKLNETQPML